MGTNLRGLDGHQKLVAFCLNQVVELAGGEFEAGVVGEFDVGLDVRGLLGGEEDDAGWVHDEGGLQHEVGQGFGEAEVGVGGCGPALAEGFVVDESGVESAEVIC
jgi:hypothetical protein